jgi:hypothetical protein
MSGNTEGTTTSSTDSGQSSEPLLDAFVATVVGGRSKHDSSKSKIVEAPESSDRLFIRRSARRASSRSHSVQASASNPSVLEVVDALPGGKRRVGYAYEVLQAVNEDPELSIRPVILAGNASSLRDTATPQHGLSASGKCSATSTAPASGPRGPISKCLASAADFSPTHFDEPLSDAPIPPLLTSHPHVLPSPHHHSNCSLPRTQVPVAPQAIVSPRRAETPVSSPISQNPLLRKGPGTPMDIQTPSPRCLPFRTQNSDVAWAAAEGLLLIPEGFTAPGYVPAHVVGGVTYTVRSPQARRPSVQPASMGRQLCTEYTVEGMQDNGERCLESQENVLPQQTASQPWATLNLQQQIASQPRATLNLQQQISLQGIDLPQRSTSHGPHLQQQQTPQDVRTLFM